MELLLVLGIFICALAIFVIFFIGLEEGFGIGIILGLCISIVLIASQVMVWKWIGSLPPIITEDKIITNVIEAANIKIIFPEPVLVTKITMSYQYSALTNNVTYKAERQRNDN